MSVKRYERFYYALFPILLISGLYVILYIVSNPSWLVWYTKTYWILLLISTWYFFILLFFGDVVKRKYKKYNNEKIWVLMPVFNEPYESLINAVNSIQSCHGNKEILIINDGSTNDTRKHIDSLRNQKGIRVHHFEKNKGKREALYWGTNFISSIQSVESIQKQEFIVTVDSDTILDKDALVRIVEPLKTSGIAAATGDVRLLNEKQNWLTRMVATYYWTGLNIYKKAQSALGMVVCCSGCLSAYRKDVLKEIIEPFINQTFLGEKCTHSEDRHLTNLALELGYKVVYVPEAISYTETPSTIKGLLKQQQRWKRGYIRESVYTLSWSWKTKKILFLEILLWDLTIPFFTFGLHLTTFYLIFTEPIYVVTQILPAWILFTFVRYIFIFKEPSKIIGMFPYMIFHELFLYWQNIYALFTVRNKSWITR